jgi:hypothetical protein
MKKLSVSGIFIIVLISCNENKSTVTDKNNDSSENITYPYKATYSSNFSISTKPEISIMVMTVWKFFESQQIDSLKKYYADTVTYDPSNGHRFHGSSAQLLSFAKQDVESLDSLRFDITMMQNVHINDKNEDWVFIWARERRYEKGGKADTSNIQEQWKVEKNKVTYFNQYASQKTSIDF